MNTFEYQNGLYTPTPGMPFITFAKDVIEDLKSKNKPDASLCFNAVTINVYKESHVYDLCEKYDFKRAFEKLNKTTK